jgi:subtilisin family serine protease
MRRAGLAVLTAGLALLAPAAAHAAGRAEAPPAAPVAGQPVPGEVLVGFERGASGSERASARRSAGVTFKRALHVPGVQLVGTGRGETIAGTIARLERDPNVRYAEPNRRRSISATIPNDALFGQLWGLDNTGQSVDSVAGTPDKDIDAPEAWDVFTGGNTLVAVVDTGIAYDHPDLAPNMWTNPGEIAGNGVDDDGNGYVDDVHGYDIVDGDPDPRDFNEHGTHVAGTIAAAGNDGAGVVGVSWSARLMAVRVLDAAGEGTDADIAEGFQYAARNGARVVNASLGGSNPSLTLQTAIHGNPNTLFVVAAGNEGENLDPATVLSTYPCAFTDANLICVAATDQNDALADFSNFGNTSVDLAAPGVNILSTLPDTDDIVLADGFESDDFAARWNPHVDRGSTSAWARTAASAANGSFSIADSPAGNYASNSETYVDIKTPVSLAGKRGCRLTFNIKIATLAGDQFTVDQSTDGGATWIRQFSLAGTSHGAYVPLTVELDADGAPSVLFGFGLVTNATGVADGVSLDDVVLRCVRPEQGAGSFGPLDGTSMATPHVAGAAALLIGRKPSLTVAQLRSALLDTGDAVPSLAGKTVTGRRLNVGNAIRSPLLEVPPTATTGAASAVTTSGATLNGTVNARSTASSYQFEYGTTTAYGSSTAATDAGAGGADQAVAAAIGGLSPNTTYHFRLVAIRGADRFPGADATFTTAAPVVTPPARKTLKQRVRNAKVACTRKRGRYRCRVSLAREAGLKVKLVVRRGKKVVGRGSGRVGKRITLKGRKAKAGRHKVKLTFTEGKKKASVTRTIKVR